MTRYLRDRLLEGKSSPGLFIVPQRSPIAEIVESLVLIWNASQSTDWLDTITYLPYR
jgi:hypothetical protein